jgi:hypothetical protein
MNGTEARAGIGAYLNFYNRERPHQTLGYQTPGAVFQEGRGRQDEEGALSSGAETFLQIAVDSLNLASSLS